LFFVVDLPSLLTFDGIYFAPVGSILETGVSSSYALPICPGISAPIPSTAALERVAAGCP